MEEVKKDEKNDRAYCPFTTLEGGKKALCTGDCALAVEVSPASYDCAFALQTNAQANAAGALMAIADFLGRLSVALPNFKTGPGKIVTPA